MFTGVPNEPPFLSSTKVVPHCAPLTHSCSLWHHSWCPVFVGHSALQTHGTCLDLRFLIYIIRWLAQMISEVFFGSSSLWSTMHCLRALPPPPLMNSWASASFLSEGRAYMCLCAHNLRIQVCMMGEREASGRWGWASVSAREVGGMSGVSVGQSVGMDGVKGHSNFNYCLLKKWNYFTTWPMTLS